MQENIFRIQASNSIIWEYFCIEFIGFMLAGKTWIDYTSLFSPYDFDKNDNVILSFFKNAWSTSYTIKFKLWDTT